MDFLNPKKRRAQKIQLFIGYGLMAIALIIGTLILVFTAYGYDIDRKTGGVIQNGLIIVDAHPDTASIILNDKVVGTTNNRFVLPAGNYTVKLTRDGYRDWQHNVNLDGGSIEQLVYPFLFPKSLNSKSVQRYNTAPTLASQSPDRRWLIVSSPSIRGDFSVTDLSDKNSQTVPVSLPAGTFNPAEGTHSWTAVEWSTDNNHLLVKHTFTGGSEFIVINRSKPTESVDITKQFASQPFTDVTLRDKKPDQFYLLNKADGSMFTADGKSQTTIPILTHVYSYKSYQADTILYATDSKITPGMIDIRALTNSKDYLIRTVSPSPTYLLDLAQFSGHMYVAVGSAKDGRVFVYKDVFKSLDDNPTKLPLANRALATKNPEYVSFSAIARFIAIQDGSKMAVFDAETGRQFKYDTNIPLAPGQKAVWMDGHRLTLIDTNNNLNVFDFDGTNHQTLNSALPGFLPFFDRDYNVLYTVSPVESVPNQAQLNRTRLKLLPAGQSE